MKVLLDACVLYPTVLREILLAVAAKGLFQPLWSQRILEEWARATRKLGPVMEQIARGEVARVQADFPQASVQVPDAVAARLVLPDPDDVHVLAAAIGAGADVLLTFNNSDFPQHVLAAEGISRRDPDRFLWELWSDTPDAVGAAVAVVHAEAERLSGEKLPLRAFLKRAGLPKLGKAMTA